MINTCLPILARRRAAARPIPEIPPVAVMPSISELWRCLYKWESLPSSSKISRQELRGPQEGCIIFNFAS